MQLIIMPWIRPLFAFKISKFNEISHRTKLFPQCNNLVGFSSINQTSIVFLKSECCMLPAACCMCTILCTIFFKSIYVCIILLCIERSFFLFGFVNCFKFLSFSIPKNTPKNDTSSLLISLSL